MCVAAPDKRHEVYILLICYLQCDIVSVACNLEPITSSTEVRLLFGILWCKTGVSVSVACMDIAFVLLKGSSFLSCLKAKKSCLSAMIAASTGRSSTNNDVRITRSASAEEKYEQIRRDGYWNKHLHSSMYWNVGSKSCCAGCFGHHTWLVFLIVLRKNQVVNFSSLVLFIPMWPSCTTTWPTTLPTILQL